MADFSIPHHPKCPAASPQVMGKRLFTKKMFAGFSRMGDEPDLNVRR